MRLNYTDMHLFKNLYLNLLSYKLKVKPIILIMIILKRQIYIPIYIKYALKLTSKYLKTEY